MAGGRGTEDAEPCPDEDELPLCEPLCELLRAGADPGEGAEDCDVPERLGVYDCDGREAVELFVPYR